MIDTHAHLTSKELLPHLEEILKRAEAQKIEKIINICTDESSLAAGLVLKKNYPWVYNAAATTPHDVEAEGASFFPIVLEAAKAGHLVAIGETGLDYHYEHSPKHLQKAYLSRYFELALWQNLPLIIHCRDAFDDLFDLADLEYREKPLVIHCFTGSCKEAKEAIDRGWMISFSGIVTFKKSEALREVLHYVPLDRLLVETDSPFLAPQSRRGQINEPAFIGETLQVIASVKGLDPHLVAAVTSENAIKFFSFSKLS
ncbi:MAG: TatD family hydrolase [Anaerolineae bacterium]